MKRIMALAGLLIFFSSMGVLIFNSVSYMKTDYWLQRAQAAGNPQQTAEYLTEYEESLQQRNLVEGKYTTILRYPGSSMGIYINVIGGLRERAISLARQNSEDESYQMGLINLEKDVNDVETAAWKVWGASGGAWWFLSFALGAALAMSALMKAMLDA